MSSKHNTYEAAEHQYDQKKMEVGHLASQVCPTIQYDHSRYTLNCYALDPNSS